MTIKELPGNNILNKLHFQDKIPFNAQTRGKRAVVTCSIQKNLQNLDAVSMDDFFTRMAVMNMDKIIFSVSRKILLSLSASQRFLKVLVQKENVLLESPLIGKEKFVGFGALDFVNRNSAIKYYDLNL